MQPVAERNAVRQAGERVVVGEKQRLLFGQPLRGLVAHDLGEAAQAAIVIP